MPKFKMKVSWIMEDTLYVDAETAEAAEDWAWKVSLKERGYMRDDSFDVETIEEVDKENDYA